MENVLERRDQIHEWMKFQQWDQVQEAWLDVLISAPQPIEFHEPLVTRLVRRKFFDWLENLYGDLLNEMIAKGAYEEAVDLIRLILRWVPDAAFILPHLQNALLGVHKDRPRERIERYFELSGLDAPAPRIAKNLKRFEELVGVSKGYVFRHSRWGLGKVVELDAEHEKVTIDFAAKKGQVFTINGVKEFLQAIPTDHFISAMVRDPDALRQRVEDDPVEALKFFLRSYGGSVAVADLKKIILEGLMDEGAWKKWWDRARVGARLDPWIDMDGMGSRAELRLRAEPRSFTDEVLGQIREASTVEVLREALRELRRHQDEAPLTPEQRAHVAQTIRQLLADSPADNIATRLGFGYLFEEFAEVIPDRPPAADWDESAFLGGDKDGDALAAIVLALPVHEHQVRACEGIQRLYPAKWPALFARLMPQVSPRLAGWLEKILAAAGEQKARHAGFDAIISDISRNPETFLWLFRQILDNDWADVAEGASRAAMYSQALEFLEKQYTLVDRGLEDVEEARRNVSRLRSFVNDSNCKYMRKVAKMCTIDEARRLLGQVMLNSAITSVIKDDIEAILISAHPELRTQTRAEAEEEAKKPAVHYTTAAALEAQRLRLSNILNVQIPENSKQIGIARQHGDLSENAEYHAAKDRQKLLHQQAQELNDLISRARVIEPDMVKTSAISFGTRFQARDVLTGEVRTFTLLGIWEAQPDQGILSYLTPLGGAFFNARIGETVDVTTNDATRHQFEILSIEKAV